MTRVLPLRARPSQAQRTARVGMIVFVSGWTMMFGALLVTYLLLRQHAEAWPPSGLPALERSLPTIATCVLLASSASLQLGLTAIRGARAAALRSYLVTTLLLGVGFLTLQIISWVHMLHRGLVANGSLYAACFYGLTAFHALHVVVGLGGLASLWPRAARGAFSAREHTAVASWTAYWHFVGAVWVIFFATVYW